MCSILYYLFIETNYSLNTLFYEIVNKFMSFFGFIYLQQIYFESSFHSCFATFKKGESVLISGSILLLFFKA